MVWVTSVGVGRRQALAGLGGMAGMVGMAGTGLLAVATAGCTGPSSADSASDGSSEVPRTPSDADAEADRQALDEAVGLTTALIGLIDSVTQGRRSLRRRLQPLQLMHSAHLDALTPDEEETAYSISTPDVPGGPEAGLRRVRRREAAARDRLLELCVGARSGPFAQLLASMAAGITVHADQLGWELPEDDA